MSSKPILYHYWRSSCSWRVRIALNLKGIEYESKTVNLLKAEHKTDEFTSLNPQHLLPTLIIDGNKLTESIAIMEYLEEKYADKHSLLPKKEEDRATVRALVLAIASNTQPVQNMRVIKYVGGGDAEKTAEFARHFIELGLQGLEKQLEKTAGEYAFGDTITMADVVIPPQVYNAIRFGVDMNKFPIINRINLKLANIPEFTEADCWHQPDTPENERSNKFQ